MSKILVAYFSASGSTSKLAQTLAGGAKVLPGKRFAPRASEAELKSWIDSLALD
ncbi:MAG: hypothetical protein IJV30_09475 [Oscillospiraceae bacterium]|nr:hypothetical protein [Oscillospiraceae bacterium]